MIIYLASGNPHKRQELAAILAGRHIRLPAEAGITGFDPEETGVTFVDNALIKARSLYRLLAARGAHSPGVPGAVLADDSGLCVDILGGRPGIYSARYPGTDGPVQKLTGGERNALLLEEVYAAAKAAGRGTAGLRCRFVCAMVLLFTPDRFYAVEETLEGEIVPSASAVRGSGGFGYDPIVYLPELGRTVAELSEEEKNRCSHRGKAGKAIAALLTGGC